MSIIMAPKFRDFKCLVDLYPPVSRYAKKQALVLLRQAMRGLEVRSCGVRHAGARARRLQGSLASCRDEAFMPAHKDGHLREAVLNSIAALFDYIRIQSGSKEDGDRLAGLRRLGAVGIGGWTFRAL